jgi:hypothetical protein
MVSDLDPDLENAWKLGHDPDPESVDLFPKH